MASEMLDLIRFLFRVRDWLGRRFGRKMKLGITYNLYDGEELLRAAIKSVRGAVDYVNVVYQDVSNAGERRLESALKLLEQLKAEGLVDEIIRYEPNLEWQARRNERRKRFIGMRACAKAGCTHFIAADVDEFYRARELEEAKRLIEKRHVDISAVSVIEYVKEPTNRLLSNYIFSPKGGLDYTFYAPFICRVVKNENPDGAFPCLVDPTRAFSSLGRFQLFPKHEIAMHHMSTVRKDLAAKFRNSSVMKDDTERAKDAFMEAKKSVLAYEFKEGRAVPEKFDFIGRYPVIKVDNEFEIEV